MHFKLTVGKKRIDKVRLRISLDRLNLELRCAPEMRWSCKPKWRVCHADNTGTREENVPPDEDVQRTRTYLGQVGVGGNPRSPAP